MLKKSVTAAGEIPINDAGAFELGPPALLEGEDIGEYERLLAQVTAAVEPVDIIEEFWVRDVVDLEWEGLRLRRFKARSIRCVDRAGVEDVLAGSSAIKSWTFGGRLVPPRPGDNPLKVGNVLEPAGLSMDHVSAKTLSAKLDDVERIDRMIANAEARRHVVLREIDRHRAAVAARLRAAAEAIEEGEFEEVPERGAPQVRTA